MNKRNELNENKKINQDEYTEFEKLLIAFITGFIFGTLLMVFIFHFDAKHAYEENPNIKLKEYWLGSEK